MSEVQSKVEQVARAIEAKLKGQEFLSYEDAARAAIEAMRKPTDAMVEAHYEAHARSTNVFASAEDVFAAMIDAALNEQVAG